MILQWCSCAKGSTHIQLKAGSPILKPVAPRALAVPIWQLLYSGPTGLSLEVSSGEGSICPLPPGKLQPVAIDLLDSAPPFEWSQSQGDPCLGFGCGRRSCCPPHKPTLPFSPPSSSPLSPPTHSNRAYQWLALLESQPFHPLVLRPSADSAPSPGTSSAMSRMWLFSRRRFE